MSDTTNGDDHQNAADQTPQTTPDPVEAMRELAVRIIQPAYIRFVTQPRPSGPPELLPGQLPPNPPIPLPVPEGSRIIGTVVQNGEPTTVLDVALSPDAALAFYRERMAALGWTQQQMPEYHQQHGGFTESTPRHPIQSMQFFVGPRGPSLRMTVTLDPEQGPLTEVHLAFDTTPDPTQGPWRRHWNAFENMVPPLEPPDGAEQRFGGGGGGGGDWRSSATLRTDLDLPAIAPHYDAPLAQAGWQRSRNGITPPVAWSTWTFTDEDGEPWRALLVILQHPEVEHQYLLDLRVQWAAGDPRIGPGARLRRRY
jgi:hypothetical protein